MNALGPGGLIQQGLIKPTFVLKCGLALLGIGALLGMVVAAAGGPLVYMYGLLGLLCAFFFSATQRSLSSLALGELVGFCIFGPLITLGAYMVQAGGNISPLALVYSLSLGLLAAAVIHVNNMRDLEGDEVVEKRTIAGMIGLQWSRAWFMVLLLGAFAVIVAMGLPHGAPHLLLITLWTLPLLVVIITGILRSNTPAGLHVVMHQTLRLEIYFTILLMAALIVMAVLPVLPRIPLHLLPV
jgi:1,4-dihydroxy-2-naphthoate octaprenyltransferase